MDWLDPLLQLPPWLIHGLSGAAAALIITGVIRRPAPTPAPATPAGASGPSPSSPP
jgi:hypothetical protein